MKAHEFGGCCGVLAKRLSELLPAQSFGNRRVRRYDKYRVIALMIEKTKKDNEKYFETFRRINVYAVKK
ncbi:MAG: hypothetical protein LBR69_03575 [Endomicrobium sp.]|jgi:hypothetical protein|nr:hypothetical protein [Endomicrobium sp.]